MRLPSLLPSRLASRLASRGAGICGACGRNRASARVRTISSSEPRWVATSLWAASTIFASVSWISMCPGRYRSIS